MGRGPWLLEIKLRCKLLSAPFLSAYIEIPWHRWMMNALAVSLLSTNLSHWQFSTPVSLRAVRWITHLPILLIIPLLKSNEPTIICCTRWLSWRVFPCWKNCLAGTSCVTPWSGSRRPILTAVPGFFSRPSFSFSYIFFLVGSVYKVWELFLPPLHKADTIIICCGRN